MKRAFRASLVGAVLLAAPAQAYYHYLHYQGRTAPFSPIYEKFNLSALPNNTVTFFVSDQGPSIYAPNDSFGSVLSQIKQAVGVWNSVPYAELRVAFGGLESYTANPSAASPGSAFPTSTTPGGDVIFIDLPGVLGLGAPTVAVPPPGSAGAAVYPIVRGVVMLSRDTTKGPGPSYLDAFFTTTVHEIGHALGLQHTWTASAMSQDVIRNTSRARPLDADDVAAFSVLYGKAGWQANYGAISGRVTFANGNPAALASVVAITPAGPAVSTLTDPNGNYRIEGLPVSNGASNYSVYVHPLPPDALFADNSGLKLPQDQNGQTFAASGPFQTIFYPGTLDPLQASVVGVGGNSVVNGINFTVQARAAVPTYNVVTYCRLNSATRTYIWSGDTTVTPAFIDATRSGPGLVIAQAAAPASLPVPQSVTMLGGFAPALLANSAPPQVVPYPSQPDTLAIYFNMPFAAGTGPRHLVFNFGNDIYVLPYGANLVQKGPPLIASAVENADGTVMVLGAGLSADSTVYVDGLKAAVATPFSGNDTAGSISVVAPPGTSGQSSVITVVNPDGQNSMFLPPANLPIHTYPVTSPPAISSVSLTALPAGAAAALDVTAVNTNFVDGQVTLGFGSDDVSVRRVWVLSPNHLVANVVVAPNAAIGFSEVSVISGLQVVSQPGGFQTQPARPGFPLIALPVVNADVNQQTVYPGSYASIYGQNLAVSGSNLVATLNEIPVPVQFAGANQVNIQIPANFPIGPAMLKINNGQQTSLPVVLQIDSPPPAIVGLSIASGQPLGSSAISKGEVLNVLVMGLDTASIGRVRVVLGGIEMGLVSVTPLANGQTQIQFVVTQSFGGTAVPLAVSLDGSVGGAWMVTVR